MPLVKVIRKGVTAAIRKVPTATCAALLPMTTDRVGKELQDDKEQPIKVESANDAFAKFKPQFSFTGYAGKEETEFKAEFVFETIKDFLPENLMKHQGFKDDDGNLHFRRNDLADLKNKVDLLYRLKDRWKLPAVRRAWAKPERRAEIIEALGRLIAELQTVKTTGGLR